MQIAAQKAPNICQSGWLPSGMAPEVIDHKTACRVQDEAARTWKVVDWIVCADHPHYPGQFVARLIAGHPLPYLLVADSLPALRRQLPPGLTRLPCRPEGMVEIWMLRRYLRVLSAVLPELAAQTQPQFAVRVK